MIKKGKGIKMGKSYRNYNVGSGTVDSKNPKSVYINISAWGEPTKEGNLNYNNIISSLNKRVKKYMFENSPQEFNRDRTIIDLDMRESGITFGKRSFMSCEITLFQNKNPLLSTEQLKDSMGNITDKIIEDVFDKFEHFNFHKKKV